MSAQVSPHSILIVDDEPNIRRVLEAMLKKEGYDVHLAESGKKAVEIASNTTIDLLISDLIMPDMTGIEVLRIIKELQPHCTAIMITAYGTIKTAVEAIKLGAYNYISKPFDMDEMRTMIQHALSNRILEQENYELREQLKTTYRFDNIVGNSGKMQELFKMIERAADSRATVLITGESGTGKELIARALHYNSPRANKPFVAVSCAALTETLLESEMFGHEKNAFTGANAQKAGRFELAHQGTLFLDEVGEIPPSIQVKLLRVLQEREFERVGGTKPLHVDVRLIAATNRDLETEVKNRKFREDLYYRLQVVQLHVPPLRERKEDIPALVDHFLVKYNRENGRRIKGCTPEAMEHLMKYDYPGNVRELENAIERAVVLADKGAKLLTCEMFPLRLRKECKIDD
jgi:DNA-binding NtrC family response regulator